MNRKTKVFVLTAGIVVLGSLLSIVLFYRSSQIRGDWMGNHLARGGWRRMGCHGFGWGNFGTNMASEEYSLESVELRMESYLQDEKLSDEFYIAEIMLFDNHAYVQLNEVLTDIGAMELLVDAKTMRISPEPGPNMMWNLKYGHMGGGMMDGFHPTNWNGEFTQMPVSEEQASQHAQEYLTSIGKDWFVDDHAETFYGYYTLHVTDSNNEIIGMLSVNGIDGDIFYHTWHGVFYDMIDAHDTDETH